ncbi:alpha/beta hydrolase [Cellulomonas telluris]|uniref:alpha/beta hydrolase n=1 Tax=Cellulomonas telluris TaxID=2306636 RepID=UPI0010A8FDAF|nr:alpha/beta hydrolase [Cellulomonas telluris]
MGPGPAPPPASCPIHWQPQALAPVFWGVRSVGPGDGAPVDLRIFFPSLDGAVESAPILAGCGRYPLVLLAHGHCHGDPQHFRRWFLIPAFLARSGYVVVVPHLAGNAGGANPSVPEHPDEATLAAVEAWARTGWEHADVLLPPPATGVVGHSFGALVAARYAVGRPVSAYAGLSGRWQDWFGAEPFPLPLLTVPSLLTWGAEEFLVPLPDPQWQAMARPRHRVVFAEGQHWDYLGTDRPPCAPPPTCPGIRGAVADLVTMFLARYLPPELATNLASEVPVDLEPPDLVLTREQEFFAGGFLGGWEALVASGGACGEVAVSQATERLLANRRTRETHSLDHPCAFVDDIALRNRVPVGARPAGFRWCDLCFPARADG